MKMVSTRPGLTGPEARKIIEGAETEALKVLLDAFFMQEGQYCLVLNEYSFNTAMALLNYATICHAANKLDDGTLELLIDSLSVAVAPREFALSVATYANYTNSKSAGIPAKILSAIRGEEFDPDDFCKRVTELSGDKFATMLGYIANSTRLQEVPRAIAKPIVKEVHKRRIVKTEHLLPMIAMNMMLPDESNAIGALLLTMASSSESCFSLSADPDGTITVAKGTGENIVPFITEN